ncbi:TIGR02391 family protein [Acidovorax sp. BL-A-41-H1]|uniref:TIGR02391 family protein n=1 Tax=Acidovorax sp. BL-A-41-H1 TaxID=3421102 RepID=UPI003F7A5773
MADLPCFTSSVLEAACRVLGDTSNGLTGPEIAYKLDALNIPDLDVGATKWKRLFNALSAAQNDKRIGNYLVLFVNLAMEPARYVSKPDVFEWRRDGLNVALAFAGYGVNERGQVVHTNRETTLTGARARAGRLKSSLEARGTHREVFAYCRAELLENNYFHAVFEATKGLADRIRKLSGLNSDGAELVNEAFSVKAPLICLNSLESETQRSEQKGVANLLIGLFGAVRNPLAHSPKTNWPMPEQDALDVLALLSYVHRKLDGSSGP